MTRVKPRVCPKFSFPSSMICQIFLKESLLPIFTKLLSKFYPRASSSSDTVDPELPDLAARDDAVGVDPAEAARLVVVHRHHGHGQHHMDWTDVMIGFCLTSALEWPHTAFCNLPLAFSSNLIRLCMLLF